MHCPVRHTSPRVARQLPRNFGWPQLATYSWKVGAGLPLEWTALQITVVERAPEMTEQEILEAACRAMEELYGLRDGHGVVHRALNCGTAHSSYTVRDTLHFHFTRKDGKRISAHAVIAFPHGTDSGLFIQPLVTRISRDIVRQL